MLFKNRQRKRICDSRLVIHFFILDEFDFDGKQKRKKKKREAKDKQKHVLNLKLTN